MQPPPAIAMPNRVRNILLAIPVYNEKNTIRTLVQETLSNLPASIRTMAMIDDGSTDGSAEVLDSLPSLDGRIIICHQKENGGYGRSMQKAFSLCLEGAYDAVITMDCDLQHRPEDLIRFAEVDADVDVVSGSRYMADSRAEGKAPEDRMEINRRITEALNRRYHWNLTDAFCGFKRYKRRAELESLVENGYAFPMEFWTLAYAKGYRVKEIPVSRIYTTDNRSFGEDLDRRRKRYAYYLRTWRAAERKMGVFPKQIPLP